MFVRFRETTYRLQASLVETRRVDGKVRHEHIASLGSIILPPSVPDRITFWQRLHERLAKLSNRVDAETHGKVLRAVHARVPMVTADEQRALQLENATGDERFWQSMHDMQAETIEGHKGLSTTAEHRVAEGQKAMAVAADRRAAAKERRERLERGDDVQGGLGKPMTRSDMERILREVGMTASDLRHCEMVHEVSEAVGFETLLKAMLKANDAKHRAERRIVRGLHRLVLAADQKEGDG